MLNTQTSRLIIMREDYELIMDYLKRNRGVLKEVWNASLLSRIEGAELRDETDFPWETIRLNSRATIRDTAARLNYEYTIVMPDAADHRKCKVSLFSPIGQSLFGFRRGQDTFWQTGNGRRHFTIMAVSQFAHR